MPVTAPLSGILETALHFDDIDRSSFFYEKSLGLQRISASPATTASAPIL